MTSKCKNLGLRILFEKEYDQINFQFGKMEAIVDQICEEDDIEKAISRGRSMRGHVAVILKALHAIKRKTRTMK